MDPKQYASFFAEQGYLVLSDLLDKSAVDTSHQEIDRLHQIALRLLDNDQLNGSDYQLEPYAKTDRTDDKPVLRKIENTRSHSPWFSTLASHRPLVSVIQSLLGKDLLLFRSTLMLKPAHHGSAHAFHQDSAYWPMDPPSLITVSIALEDATPENGCIKVIPGSHRGELQTWGHIAQEEHAPLTERKEVDLSGQIDVPLTAGSAVLFHSKLVHGSGANRTDKSRNTALYAYFSPDVRYKPGPNAPQRRSFPVIAGMNGATEHEMVAG